MAIAADVLYFPQYPENYKLRPLLPEPELSYKLPEGYTLFNSNQCLPPFKRLPDRDIFPSGFFMQINILHSTRISAIFRHII